MPISWLKREETLPDLIARKKYDRAIQVLRENLAENAPTVPVRLRLADVLVLAGRGKEAVPLFLDLADDFARDHFIAKAIAVLKRVEKISPGPEVEEKLQALVKEQHRLHAATPTTTMLHPPRRSHPEFGIEAFGEQSGELELAEIEREAISGEVAAEEEEPMAFDGAPGLGLDEILERVEGGRSAAPDAEPEADAATDEPPAAREMTEATDEEVVDEAELHSVEVATDGSGEARVVAAESGEEQPAADQGSNAGMTSRIRGAFRRFLSSLPKPAPEAAAQIELAEPGEAPEESLAPDAQDETLTEMIPEPEETTDGATSEDQFQDQLLDLIADAAQAPEGPSPLEKEPERPTDPTQRLLASPLFGDLDEAAMLAVVHGLVLRTFGPGEIVVSERESGQSLFIVTVGRVKVYVRNPSGRNILVKILEEGDFFGEISGLSGRPRSATVTAGSDPCELLELDKKTLDSIAGAHPAVRDQLEAHYIERAGSPEVAAIRTVQLHDEAAQERAIEVLEAHFGERRFHPRMRLRLANVFLKSGKEDEAVPILIGLADEMARSGFAEKAIALIKKVEEIQQRHVEEVNLAPLKKKPAAKPPPPAAAPRAPAGGDDSRDSFGSWLVDIVRERADGAEAMTGKPDVVGPIGYRASLQSTPLFEDFSEDELVAVIRVMRLLRVGPGDIIVSEGEQSQGLFILATGRVRVFVRDEENHNNWVSDIEEGSFFGEMSTLSGRPRAATVTVAAPTDLLELDREAVDGLTKGHPHLREVLESHYTDRIKSRNAATRSVRTAAPAPPS